MKRKILFAMPVLIGLIAPALSSCAYNTNPTTAEGCPGLLTCSDGEIPMADGSKWFVDHDE